MNIRKASWALVHLALIVTSVTGILSFFHVIGLKMYNLIT